MKKMHPLLKKEIRLPEMDELKVLAIVVALIAVSIFTVDKYVGLSNYRGEAASMYQPLTTKSLLRKSSSSSVRARIVPVKKTDLKSAGKEQVKSVAPKTNCKSRAAQRRNPACKKQSSSRATRIR